MRKQDIKLGTVYAYRRGTYGQPIPLVFLSLDLHAQPTPRREAGPWFIPAPHDRRPRRGDIYPDVGYPAAVGNLATSHETLAALSADLITASRLSDDLADAGIVRRLVIRMADVLGPWDDVMAARSADQERARQERAAEQQESDARRARATAVLRTFWAAGLGDGDLSTEDDGLVVTMTIEAAERLAALLESVPAASADDGTEAPAWLDASQPTGALFRTWLDEAFPDGMGSGTGGTHDQDDLEAAFLAGVLLGQHGSSQPDETEE